MAMYRSFMFLGSVLISVTCAESANAQTSANDRRLPITLRLRVEAATKPRSGSGDSLAANRTGTTVIYKPAFGYTWRNPQNNNDLSARLKDHLRKLNQFLIAPAAGYQWATPLYEKDDRVVRVGLVIAGDSSVIPDTGFIWLNPNDAKDDRVRVRDGLVRHADGWFSPAQGYSWSGKDPNDLSVLQVTGVPRPTGETVPSVIQRAVSNPTRKEGAPVVDVMGVPRVNAASPPPSSLGEPPSRGVAPDGPSLGETRTWLISRVAGTGTFDYTVEQNALGGLTTVMGSWDRRVEDFDIQGCKLSFVRRSVYGGGGKKGETWRSSRVTADLSKLDPAAVRIEQSEDGINLDERITRNLTIWWWKVIAPAAPGSKAVMVEILASKDKKLVGSTWYENFLDLDSTDRELSKRISTALSHAIQLCGGKVEPF